jgi:filamentous hemagglutinin family protein
MEAAVINRHIPRRSVILSGVSAMALLASAAYADDLPTGGSIASGTASISSGVNSTTINQSSDRAVLNWNSFSVGQGNSVTFNQPSSSSATLNRVTGAATSSIAGNISSNGAVYLINPNGISITATGSVYTAGGFVASTLDMVDSDFMAGNIKFNGTGASGHVHNGGSITAGQGAYVALLGGSVSNSGYLNVPLGRVGLGSGESVALDLNGGGFMQVAVPTGVLTGTNALIDNAGAISASGGSVQLKAATVKDAVRNIINMSGSINADSAIGNGGTIILLGGADTANMGGTVTVNGTLSANATGATGDGGFIETSGANVNFAGLSVSAASAHGASGTWLIDPTDLTIDAAAAVVISAALGGANVTVQTNGDGSTIGPGTLAAGPGDIFVNSNISWANSNTLTLSAYHSIFINNGVTISTSVSSINLSLFSDNSGTGEGSVFFGALAKVGSTLGGLVTLTYNPASNPFTATPSVNTTSYAAGGTDYSGNISGGTLLAYMLLNNIYDLQNVNNNLNGRYALGKNIDASVTSGWNAGAGFVPLGTDGLGNVLNSGNGYNGILDGLGRTVTNLTVYRPNANYMGLFGSTGGAAGLRNIGLNGGSITGNGVVGGLVGKNGNSLFHVFSSATVTGLLGGVVGGLVGQNAGSITDAYAGGYVDGGGGSIVGGLVGLNNSSGVININFAYATGKVTSANVAVGGLVGYNAGNIDNAYATGTVSGTSLIGGLVGAQVVGGTVSTRSYWDSYSGLATGVGSNAAGAGTFNATAITSDPAQSAAANYAYKTSAYTFSSPIRWTFFDGQTRPFLAFEAAQVVPGTITITNSHQLQLINASSAALSAKYVLGNSIDLSETGRVSVGTSSSYNGMWAGTGFVPLGTDGAGTTLNSGNGFTGSFNGQNFTLNTLTIKRPTANRVGLFGYAGSAAVISNVGLLGGVVNGQSSVGALGGYSYAHITNAYAQVNVSTGGNVAGGLVGSNQAAGVITGSYATGSVAVGSTGYDAGGLVGQNFGAVSNSFATGNVNGGTGGYTGGLLGFSGGVVTNVYATGAVTATGTNSGGLVGQNSSTITNAYATGAVTSSANFVGGFVGNNTSTISNAYSSGRVAGMGTSVGQFAGANPLGASLTASYVDFYSAGSGGIVSGTGTNAGVNTLSSVTSDPGSVGFANYAYNTAGAYPLFTPAAWVFLAGNTTRPFLAFEVAQPVNGVVTITNAHQLQLINATSTTLGQSYVLGNNIDLSETGRVVVGQAATYAGMWAGTGWVPLGMDGAGMSLNTGNGFNGSFDGQKNTLFNLTIKRPTSTRVGLFGVAGPAAVINNVGVSSGTVSGGSFVGALVGNSFAHITNSYAVASVSASTSLAGGLVGSNQSAGVITGSYATGAVTGGTFDTGGLVAQNLGIVSNSYATGNVNGGTGGYTGGLIGFSSGTVTNVYATGNVTAGVGGYTGGLIGSNSSSSVLSSAYATGAVNGGTGTKTGGLVGYNFGSINNAYALGAVSGTGGTSGGLIGLNQGIISNTYATGRVTATGTNVGGFVGNNQGAAATITTSYWDTFSTGVAAGFGANNGTFSATAITSDPAQSGAANYAYKTSAYAFTTPSSWTFFDGLTRPFGAWELPAAVNGVTTITNAHQLQLINTSAATLGRSYSQRGDIEANKTGAVFVGVSSTYSDMWANTGFVPIGNNANPFTGIFNGDGGYINNVTINNPALNYAGVFGNIAASGTVTGVSILGGAVNGGSVVGGLAGANFGTVSNSYSNATVNGNTYVGGLIGYTSGIVTFSTGAGTVTGINDVGGLIGYMAAGAYSYFGTDFGNVSGTNFTGGLVGYQVFGSTLLNGSAYGNVSGTGAGNLYVGGLVGGTLGTITNGFAAGAVTGGSYVGGLVGFQQAGTITNGTTNGTVTSTGNFTGGLVGVSSANITSGKALGAVSGANYIGGLVGYYVTGTIASSAASGAVNGGFLIGGLVGYMNNGATISGSTANGGNVTGTSYAGGLVGLQVASTVTNSSSNRPVTITGNYAGGLVGYQSGGLISGGSSAGVVSGANLVGGLIGYQDATATVLGSLATTIASVSGTNYVGGLIGFALGTVGSVAALTSSNRSVSGTTYVGGLIGYSAGATVSNVSANSTVNGTTSIGGLIGYQDAGSSLVNGRETGNVTGSATSAYVGGLIGTALGTITQSYAVGNISGFDYVGGLVGYQAAGTISRSYALGPVVGTHNFSGGLVGTSSGNIDNSFALGGGVTGTNYVGGLVGYYSVGTISNSFVATGPVTGVSVIGGLLGFQASGSVTGSVWNQTTTGRSNGFGTQAAGTFSALNSNTSAMQNPARIGEVYTGWDFVNIWNLPVLNTAYPTLK